MGAKRKNVGLKAAADKSQPPILKSSDLALQKSPIALMPRVIFTTTHCKSNNVQILVTAEKKKQHVILFQGWKGHLTDAQWQRPASVPQRCRDTHKGTSQKQQTAAGIFSVQEHKDNYRRRNKDFIKSLTVPLLEGKNYGCTFFLLDSLACQQRLGEMHLKNFLKKGIKTLRSKAQRRKWPQSRSYPK